MPQYPKPSAQINMTYAVVRAIGMRWNVKQVGVVLGAFKFVTSVNRAASELVSECGGSLSVGDPITFNLVIMAWCIVIQDKRFSKTHEPLTHEPLTHATHTNSMRS